MDFISPNTSSVGGLINTALTWEKVRTWDVGVDYGLFNNRLTGSFDYFVRFTEGMVGPSAELPRFPPRRLGRAGLLLCGRGPGGPVF